MAHKDPEERRAWDRVNKRLKRAGVKMTPAELKQLAGAGGNKPSLQRVALELPSSAALSVADSSVPDAAAERQAALGQRLQAVANSLIDQVEAGDAPVSVLEMARKCAMDGVKIERLATGLATSHEASTTVNHRVLTHRLVADPEAIDAVHRILELSGD